MLELLEPSVEFFGEVIDRAVLMSSFGSTILGIPGDITYDSQSLGPILRSMASYNATQANKLQDLALVHQTLGLASLVTGVSAKVLCEDYALGPLWKSGPFGFVQAVDALKNIKREGKDKGNTLLSIGSSGWFQATTTAAMLTDKSGSDMTKPGAVLSSIMRALVPSLEYNGFAEVFPMGGPPEVASSAIAKTLIVDDKTITAWFEVPSERTSNFPDLGAYMEFMGGGNKAQVQGNEREDSSDDEKPELARGLMIIGDPALSRDVSSPDGFTSQGGGMSVGVDDGRRYM